MSKPSKLPRWATSAFTVTEPDELKKNGGYGAGEKPAPKVMNWLFNTIYAWCAYLQGLHTEPDFLGQAYTWTAVHVFQLGVAVGQLLSAGNIYLAPGAHLRYSDVAGALQARTVTKHVPLNFLYASSGGASRWKANADGTVQSEGGSVSGALYLDLPSGAVLKQIVLGVTDAVSFTLDVTLKREEVSYFGYAGLPMTRTTLMAESSDATGNYQTVGTPDVFAETINNQANRYRLDITANAAGIKIHYVFAVFDDNGFMGNG
jgi:hypothetical protein